MNEGHLIDVDSQERENAAVQYLCDTPFLLNDLLGPLGLHPNFYWVLLQVPHGKLVTGRFGDVDLMAGPLRLATKDGFEWPPMLDQLVAIEAKCAYRSPTEPAVKAQKASAGNVRQVRTQLEELWRFVPFNRVALLDIVINPPSGGMDGQAWARAAAAAADSLDLMRRTLADRLPAESGFGHLAFSWGSVVGADERQRGSGTPLQWREARENPYLCEPDVQQRRRELESNLKQILSAWPSAPRMPAILGPYSPPEVVR